MISYSATLSTLLPFSGADSTAMAEQQQWFAGKPEENFGLSLASDTEAYGGHLGKARELTKRAVDSAIRADSKETGAIWQANAALDEAAYGNPAEARQSAADALKLAPTSQGVEVEAALAFAMAGDTARAESLAQDLSETLPARHPDAVALAARDSGAIGAGQKEPGFRPDCPASCFTHRVRADSVRLQYFLPLSDVYARRSILGSRTRQCSRRRVSEDSRPQRHCLELLDGSLGASGRGSCQRAMQVENLAGERMPIAARVRALAAYKDFLTLWKDADPDIPILKEAKAEYAKLQ